MTFIDAPSLKAALESDDRPVVLDARWPGAGSPLGDGHHAFEAGHIPGSQWVSVEGELSNSSAPGGRHPLPDEGEFEAAMRRKGLREDSQIVVVDGGSGQGAGRLWWLLTDGGITDVQVLNGGFAAWQKAGYPVETGPTWSAVEGDIILRAGHLGRVDADQVMVHPGNLWDVRAPERYRGEREPLDAKAGHIPGAKNLPVANAMQPGGGFKTAADVKKLYADVRPGDVVYCGSGITAAQSVMAMHEAGIRGVLLYPGSWSEWSSDDSRPTEQG